MENHSTGLGKLTIWDNLLGYQPPVKVISTRIRRIVLTDNQFIMHNGWLIRI